MERTRRLRMNERVRDMVRENHVRVDELIYPIFVIEGENICEPVESMPGICQYSIDRLHEELDRVREAGIPAVLFAILRKITKNLLLLRMSACVNTHHMDTAV